MGYLNKIAIDNTYYTIAGGLYGTCDTAAATAEKVVTLASFDSLESGTTIRVKFTNSNTASNATMNVNSTGAKDLRRDTNTLVGTTVKTSWHAGSIVSFTYDSVTSSWIQQDFMEDTDTKNTAGSTNSSSKLFLIGATSQSANPQTYSHDTAYVGTDGHLYSDSKQVVNLSGSQALTNKTYNGYTLGAACAKGVDTSISSGSTSTNVPTSAAVASLVASMQAGAATFQGTLVASDGDGATSWTEAQLEAASYKKGWYWVCAVATATFAGKNLEAGDMLFCVSDKGSAYAAADFAAVQNNIETLTNAEIDALWAAA